MNDCMQQFAECSWLAGQIIESSESLRLLFVFRQSSEDMLTNLRKF